MREITHQKQPTSNSCVCTCLAMLADLPAQQIIDEYHDHYRNQTMSEIQLLDKVGIHGVPASSITRVLNAGQLYLVAAQSLNYPQVSHQIIVDCRPWPDGYRVYDPQMGNEGSKFYVPHYYDLAEDETGLATHFIGGWHVDFRVLGCAVIGGSV